MADWELKDIDRDDIQDVLIKVEDSFNFRFEDNEMAHVTTFGQLCDHITNKLQLENTGGCTSQQAFYKLRKAIAASLQISPERITPSVTWENILPYSNRIKNVKLIEKNIGFKLKLLQPEGYVTTIIAIGFFLTVGLVFFMPLAGVVSLLLLATAQVIAVQTGKTFTVETIGEMAEKISRENYHNARRNPATINRGEIEKVLVDLFSKELDLHHSKLNRSAGFR